MPEPTERSISTEWLVTNGLGGYAMGTLAGTPTRTYHGLLIAALAPPVERTVLVGGCLETLEVGDRTVTLHALERTDGSFVGDGPAHLRDVRLDGSMPVWSFDLGNGLHLDRRVWMAHEANTTYIRYAIDGGSALLRLEPLTARRDHHAVAGPADGPGGPGDGPLRILAPGATVVPAGRWWRGIRLREETARGQLDATDAWIPVTVQAELRPGRPFTLILTAEDDAGADPEADSPGADRASPELALAQARARDRALLAMADAGSASAEVRQLVLAADAFLVRRTTPGFVDGRTVIAGYPWFNDWGRDTMIALPGLCLTTGRGAEAATILRSFARVVRDGLLPNDFPDDPRAEPAYHTIDASLWFVQAVRAQVEAGGDTALLHDLLPTVRAIVDAHIAGTRFGIAMDPDDGLLRGGADGVQLTWMDAKVDGWVVTPRRGKPVEIQALWINALLELSRWTGDPSYSAIADVATTSFRGRFWRPERGYLADVVDGPDGDELDLRPNQLLALSLPHPLVDSTIARSVLAAVRRELLVPLALRSLAPTDPAYRGHYQGDRRARDDAYHQGTAWTWLIGPYADAVARFDGGPSAALAAVSSITTHLEVAGFGSVSEIMEPEAPFEGRGCPFQAWGVAEVLRVLRRYGG